MKTKIEVPDKLRCITEVLHYIPVGSIPNVKRKHIAVLILALRDLIQNGSISSRRIFFDKSVEDSYANYWKNLPKATAGSAFLQMGESEFFSLFLKNTISKKNLIWNNSNVNRYVHFGVLSEELFEVLKDQKMNNYLYNYFQIRFIEDISVKIQMAARKGNNKTIMESENEWIKVHCNEENFMNYFSSVKSSNGKMFDNGQIKMYCNGIYSDYMKKLLKKNGYESIFQIIDFAFLLCLEEVVAYDYSKGKIGVQTLFGLRQYMRFISSLYRYIDSIIIIKQ